MHQRDDNPFALIASELARRALGDPADDDATVVEIDRQLFAVHGRPLTVSEIRLVGLEMIEEIARLVRAGGESDRRIKVLRAQAIVALNAEFPLVN
jgi:hypothetical protein